MTAPSPVSAPPSADPLARLRIHRNRSQPKKSWFKTFFKITAFLLILGALLGGGALLAVHRGWIDPPSSLVALPEALQPRVEVRLAALSVETGQAAEATVVATGYLESRRQAKIGARAPGRLEVVKVEEGSRVRGGEVLAILEHADLDASLAAIEATVLKAQAAIDEQDVVIEQTKRDWERAERLQKSMSIAEADYDKARFAYQSAVARRAALVAEKTLAEARVRESQQLKENMFIRAPFDGTVISKDAEVGESILPGGMGEASGRGSAVTVADLEHLEVDCDVKEDYINRVSSGQEAEVAVDAVPGFRYRGRVRKIIPMGDRARATIKVKVEILNVDDRLFPEMSATVYFLPAGKAAASEPQQRRILCEREAVHASNQGPFVWVLDARDRLQRVTVETGIEQDDRVEITQGLEGSERVAIAPPHLEPGTLAKPAE